MANDRYILLVGLGDHWAISREFELPENRTAFVAIEVNGNVLTIKNNGSKLEVKTLGPNIFRGQAPQITIAKQQWQSARSLGRWTLVGTTGKMNLLLFLAILY